MTGMEPWKGYEVTRQERGRRDGVFHDQVRRNIATFALFGLGLAILVILVFAVSRKKSLAPFNESTADTPAVAKLQTQSGFETVVETTSKQIGYSPEQVERAALQVLESAHIISTSTAIDTVIGRYEFLITVIPELQEVYRNGRYISDVQSAIDRYKQMYYDRVPLDSMLGLVVAPRMFDIPEFYCEALSSAFLAQFNETVESVKLLNVRMPFANARRRLLKFCV